MTPEKEQPPKADEQAVSLENSLKEVKTALESQEALNSELEFLENELLEADEKIRFLEKEVEIRQVRIEQFEQEHSSANATIRNFQDHISRLEDENQGALAKLKAATTELDSVSVEKENCKSELEKAEEVVREIRLILAQIRSKQRNDYHKRRQIHAE